MTEEKRPGFYLDKDGVWQADRRSGIDRRDLFPSDARFHERRTIYRRQMDRELYEKDHKVMIEEALEDFAQEHDGHL